MTAASLITLTFDDGLPDAIRARITYAFRVFAAIYNYKVVNAGKNGEAICVHYGKASPNSPGSNTLHVPTLYRQSYSENGHSVLAEHCYAGTRIPLKFGLDPITGRPDWLGEVFEWISSSLERGVAGRDPVGRIAYSGTVFGKGQISPRKPYAAMVMAWMQNSLRNGDTLEALAKAPSPMHDAQHLVVCSHDVDFSYTDRASALLRLFKNLAISYRDYRSWPFFVWNSKNFFKVLNGDRVGEYLPQLFAALEELDFRSTVFVAARRAHRRDPNYQLKDLQPQLCAAVERGFSVAVHGSYGSCIEEGTLVSETAALEKAIGSKPRGGRQHWLRFDSHQRLFDMVAEAGLLYDSTLGFSQTIGFRNGANFAFPPYDFRNEKPYEFLEIPLVIMDGALQAASLTLQENPQVIADEVLHESRRWGWGGISALWHNPMEPIQVPEEINQVFWNCARKRQQFQEKWMSADEFLACSLSRYKNAGLLESVHVDA